MRNEVTVDGVKLTREQVEKAQKELDKPEELKELELNVPYKWSSYPISTQSKIYYKVGAELHKLLDARHGPCGVGWTRVFSPEGGQTYCLPLSSFKRA